MHLLQTRPGGYVEGEGIARIEQSPAPLVITAIVDLASGFSRTTPSCQAARRNRYIFKNARSNVS